MRSIPSIEQLRQRPAIRALEQRYGRAAIVDALRAEAAAVRQWARDGHAAPDGDSSCHSWSSTGSGCIEPVASRPSTGGSGGSTPNSSRAHRDWP